MISDFYQLAIIAFILIGIGVAIWRGGQANPESTGKLARKQAQFEADLKAVKSKVDAIENRVTEIDRRAATIADIERVEGQLAEAKVARDRIDQSTADIVKTVAADHEAIGWIKDALGRMDQYLRQRDG